MVVEDNHLFVTADGLGMVTESFKRHTHLIKRVGSAFGTFLEDGQAFQGFLRFVVEVQIAQHATGQVERFFLIAAGEFAGAVAADILKKFDGLVVIAKKFFDATTDNLGRDVLGFGHLSQLQQMIGPVDDVLVRALFVQ